jgi:hypothetical protein
MKISEVLHLELAKDKRGKGVEREMYRECFDFMEWVPELGTYKMEPKTETQMKLFQWIAQDDNFMHHVAMVKRIVDFNHDAYYIPKEFLKALSKMDRGIPIEYLPENFYGYFQFPKNVLFDEQSAVKCAYVFVGKVANHHSRHGDFGGKKLSDDMFMISLSYVTEDGAVTKFMWPLTPDKLSEICRGTWSEDTLPVIDKSGKVIVNKSDAKENKSKRTPIIIACLNAVLYIASEDPQLNNLIPKRLNKGGSKFFGNGYQNLCTIPLILVNQSYREEERKYNVDEAWWNPHMRWQRCGENNSKVKLIWVKGHKKTFNKGDKNE